jgi:hypothetical protein
MSKPRPLHYYLNTRMAWYRPEDPPTVMIGDYSEEGDGEYGELLIRWHDLSKSTPCLEAFNDAWTLFTHPDFRVFLSWMSSMHSTHPTPERVCDALYELGFICDNHPPEKIKAHMLRKAAQLETEAARLRKAVSP